jgi:hypothetical protein
MSEVNEVCKARDGAEGACDNKVRAAATADHALHAATAAPSEAATQTETMIQPVIDDIHFCSATELSTGYPQEHDADTY